MEKKTLNKDTKSKPIQKIEKSKRLISFREFMLGKDLRRELKASFNIWLDGKDYATNEDWEKLLKEFLNR